MALLRCRGSRALTVTRHAAEVSGLRAGSLCRRVGIPVPSEKLPSKCVPEMLVLSRNQDRFRRIESLLSSPIIVQRLVHCQWQTRRKSSALSEIKNIESPEEEEVSRDRSFPKRVDGLWKVGGNVSGDGGIENAVTNAANIGSVMLRLFPCYQKL